MVPPRPLSPRVPAVAGRQFELLPMRQLWNVLHFYVPDGSRFFKCNKNRYFLLSCFKQCVLGLSGLLGLNAAIILPFYCNAVIA